MKGGHLLAIEELHVRFGGLIVLEGVSMEVGDGSFFGIIGPNGAGKTTLLNAISGLVPVQAGAIRFGNDEVDLTRRGPHVRARLGISRTFQHSSLFKGLTILDQLLCGAYSAARYDPISSLGRLPHVLRREGSLKRDALGLLADLGLRGAENLTIDRLPGAHRRLVDLARSLMTRPRLLLLDEIAAGTSVEERQTVIRLLRRRQADDGMSIVVIEHDLEFIRALATDLVVLAEGRVLSRGEPTEVLARPEVLHAYVGEER